MYKRQGTYDTPISSHHRRRCSRWVVVGRRRGAATRDKRTITTPITATCSRARVETGNDPGLPIESDALRSIYRNYEKIHTTVEPTATGIVVVQTSSDSETVAALQRHASEVTGFVTDGMAAMHAAMMKNGGMMHGMHGGVTETAPQRETTPSPK